MTKAPICSWDLRVRFRTKQQAVDAVKLILDEPIDFDVSYSVELDETSAFYVVDIDAMPWADNIATIAEIMRRVDYHPPA